MVYEIELALVVSPDLNRATGKGKGLLAPLRDIVTSV